MKRVEISVHMPEGRFVVHTQKFADDDRHYVRRLFNLMVKHFGPCVETRADGNEVMWSFAEACVWLEGDVKYAHGIRSCHR